MLMDVELKYITPQLSAIPKRKGRSSAALSRSTPSSLARKRLTKPFGPPVIAEQTAIQPFPFMGLPREIRNMIYKELLIMPGYISIGGFFLSQSMVRICVQGPAGLYRLLRPPQHIDQKSVCSLFKVSRTFYRECRPLYFRLNTFQIGDLHKLSMFLTKIGPDCRRNLTSLRIRYHGQTAGNSLKLLVRCVTLRHLHITFGVDYRPVEHPKTRVRRPGLIKPNVGLMNASGLKDLMKLRGLETLEICVTPPSLYSDIEDVRIAMQVTKQPQDSATLERQENLDYPKKIHETRLRQSKRII